MIDSALSSYGSDQQAMQIAQIAFLLVERNGRISRRWRVSFTHRLLLADQRIHLRHGHQWHVLVLGDGDPAKEVPLTGRHDVFQYVIAFGLDLPGVVHQDWVLREVEPGPLWFGDTLLHPDKPTDHLPEIHFSEHVGAIDADAQARDVHTFADHIDG